MMMLFENNVRQVRLPERRREKIKKKEKLETGKKREREENNEMEGGRDGAREKWESRKREMRR